MTAPQQPQKPPTSPQSSPLVSALMGLSDSLSNLVRQHFMLARHELRADARSAAKDIGAICVALFFIMVGYVLLQVTAILFAAWFGGIVAMAISALLLALINLIGGALTLRGLRAQIATRQYGLHYTGQELQRSKAWAKQIPETL